MVIAVLALIGIAWLLLPLIALLRSCQTGRELRDIRRHLAYLEGRMNATDPLAARRDASPAPPIHPQPAAEPAAPAPNPVPVSTPTAPPAPALPEWSRIPPPRTAAASSASRGFDLEERIGGRWLQHAQRLRTVIDACDAYHASQIASTAVRYTGIGRGIGLPSAPLVGAVAAGLRAVERGLANEAALLLERIDARLGADGHARLDHDAARGLTACCISRCELDEPGSIERVPSVDGFRSRLVACAVDR